MGFLLSVDARNHVEQWLAWVCALMPYVLILFILFAILMPMMRRNRRAVDRNLEHMYRLELHMRNIETRLGSIDDRLASNIGSRGEDALPDAQTHPTAGAETGAVAEVKGPQGEQP